MNDEHVYITKYSVQNVLIFNTIFKLHIIYEM